MQTTTYKLNITPGGIPLTIHISQYDVGLREYTFEPYTNVGEFTYVPGANATLEATKPDGYAVVHNCGYNQDGTITYTIQEQLAAKPGRVWSKVVLRYGTDVLGTGAIVWIVDNAGVKDSAIVSDSDITGIRGMIDTEVKRNLATEMVSLLPEGNASGAIAHFIDGADDIPVKDLKIGIVPKQSGSGDPSPSNVRPITGWMGATVTRVGKNLINDSIKTVQSSSTCVIGQTSTSEFNVYLPAGTYTISFGSSKEPGIYYRLSTESSGSHTVIAYGSKQGTFTLTANVHLRIWAYLSGGIAPSDIEWFQLEYGSTATAREPYTAQTYPISWEAEAGTIYGGTLDATTGVLTVTHTNIRLTSTNQTWTATKAVGTGLRYYAIIAPAIDTNATDILCSQAVYSSGNEGNWGTYNLYSGRFAIKNNDGGAGFTSIDDFKTWLDSQNFQICYPLATPQTYQLTPTEVSTLLGINNIWADTGDIDVTYKADTQLYIDKKITATKSIIAGVETEYKATKNYTTGQFLIVGDNLYKATANIANGATIAVGTNVVSTTVAEQLIALANS